MPNGTSKKRLKVGVFVDPPCINEEWRDSHKPGIFIELTNIFCDALHIKCDFVEASTNEYGHFENGTWHGMVHHIAERTYDFSFPGFTPTEERFRVIDFSDRVYKVPLVLATRAAEQSGMSLWSFMAFHWSVWLCLLGASAFIGVFLAFVESTKISAKTFVPLSFARCLDSFAIMSNQGPDFEMVRTSVRLLITFWAMATLVLGGVYSGHLLSFMIGPTPRLPFIDFGSFVTCVEELDCSLVVNSISLSYIQEIHNSPDQTLKRLNAALYKNPIIVASDKDVLNVILGSKKQYIVWYTVQPHYLSVTGKNKDCLFAQLESGFTDDMAFPLHKKSPLAESINTNVSFMNSLGIPQKVYNDYVGVEAECGAKQIEGSKPLPFTSIVGLLFILMCGGALGLGGLVCEGVSHKWTLRNNNKFKYSISLQSTVNSTEALTVVSNEKDSQFE